MSEEKIIEILKKLISWKGMKVEIRDYEIEAIQGLLDLYKELKEKNAEHIEVITEWVNGERINDIKHISKDKIKAKIKELEDNMILFTNDKEKFNRYKYTRDTLEKLLGE